MRPIPKNSDLEAYIQDEVIVDAHDDWEIASSWEQYLMDHLPFPFEAYGTSGRQMTGKQRIRMVVVGLHPKAEVTIRQVLLLAQLPEKYQVDDQPWHFAIRAVDLWPPEGWKFDPDWREGDEPDPWQVLYHWAYWVQHMT